MPIVSVRNFVSTLNGEGRRFIWKRRPFNTRIMDLFAINMNKLDDKGKLDMGRGKVIGAHPCIPGKGNIGWFVR